LALALLAAMLLVPGPGGRADDAPARPALTVADVEDLFGTEWFGVYLQERKIGFASETLGYLDAKKKEGFLAVMRLDARIKSLGQELELKFDEKLEFDGPPTYALRRGQSGMTQGKDRKDVVVKRAAAGYEAVLTAAGDRSQKTLPGLQFSLSDRLGPAMWLRRGAKPGDTLTTRN